MSDVRGGARRKIANPFDLLNNDSLSESEVKEDDDLGTESASLAAAGQNRRDGPPIGGGAGAGGLAGDEGRSKKKRKAKNRKRGGSKANLMPKSSEDNLEEFEDEVERSVQEVNKLLGTSPGTSSEHRIFRNKTQSESESVVKTLMAIEPKNLNPENEMKKIFGSRVVMAEARTGGGHGGGGAGGANRRGSRTRGPHHHHVKHHWLIVPKPSWPHPGKNGLSMKFLESDEDGNQIFTFDHSKDYQEVQQQFYQAVESIQPDYIVQILNVHPFHIDSMLQLSEICKMGEDSQMATELIERTLFAMEAAFHPLFNMAVGAARLDYRRQENRAFFLALYRHMTYVGSRACYRTALELCKVILNLDPKADPLAIVLVLDFFALRSNQHNWLLKLYNEWEPSRNLSQLPNFAYSVAVAKFELSQQKDVREKGEEGKVMAEADAALQYALSMFPGVLLPLLDKCSIEPDSRAATHAFFLEGSSNAPPGLQILSKLYVHRSYHIWKDPNLLPWLERNVIAVMDKADSGSDEIRDFAPKRKTRYQGTPRNIYRHVIVSDISEVTSQLPSTISDTPILSYDPLPPTDSVDTYSAASRRLAGSNNAGGGGETSETTP